MQIINQMKMKTKYSEIHRNRENFQEIFRIIDQLKYVGFIRRE